MCEIGAVNGESEFLSDRLTIRNIIVIFIHVKSHMLGYFNMHEESIDQQNVFINFNFFVFIFTIYSSNIWYTFVRTNMFCL